MSFCITGKLSMKRDDLVRIIEQNGGKVASVNKNLTYLICNDKSSTSGKSKKAADLGITIITEDEFMSMI
jgi:DNA ligase (NAD+)